jgi:hypothetical protein
MLLIDGFQYSSDILAASRTLLRPRFSFIPMQGDKNPTLKDRLCFSLTELEQDFGRLYKIGFTAELAEVFQAMKAYTSILEGYQEGSMAETNMCMISDQRNLVQHHLMSLPSADQLDEDFRQSHPVYETCRLSGIIFSAGIIFPLPAQTAPLPNLVICVQAELQESNFKSNWSSPDAVRVLIWVLMLSGIAATNMPERRWFVAALGRVAAYAGLSTWRDLKQVLKLMLWLDSACDSAGQQLWDEVRPLSRSDVKSVSVI